MWAKVVGFDFQTVGSMTLGGAVSKTVIFILLARWRNQKSLERVLVLFYSKNLQKNSPGEREKQATVIKVIIIRSYVLLTLIFVLVTP